VLGGAFLTSFTWLGSIKFLKDTFPGQWFMNLWASVGPGLAGIGIGRQPSGIIPTVGQEQRDKKARKLAAQKQSELPPPPPVGTAPATADATQASVPAPGA
jgi:hypothetical protein